MKSRIISEADFMQFQKNAFADADTGPAVLTGCTIKRAGNGGTGTPTSSNYVASYTLALTGQLISGKNRVRIRRDGHHYPEKQFINWRSRAYQQILEQRPPGPHLVITSPVRLVCEYWPGDLRTRDVTGQLDAIFYLLAYAKIIKDDGLIWDVKWTRHDINEKFPKLLLEIRPY